MSRPVTSLRLALDRLQTEMNAEAVSDRGSTAKRAASLAFVLRRQPDADAIRDRIRWTGRIPARGLSGWQEEALEWLRVEPAP